MSDDTPALSGSAELLLAEVTDEFLERLNRGEAEPLLLEGYERMKPSASAASNKEEALKRIVRLYEVRHAAEPDKGYDVKAAEWRAKLGEEGTAGEEPAPSPATHPPSTAPDDSDGSE